MKLYVCWGTQQVPGMREHPCKIAYEALLDADQQPEVVKVHSWGALPRAIQTGGRKLVEDKTGKKWVPALETDDGQWISGTSDIVDWAEQHARV